MKLFYFPRTRATRVLWLLEEAGAEYDLEQLEWEQRESPEHLARHPLGRVPALEVDGGVLFESAALCLHIADLHPEAGLIGPLGSYERGLAYQWSFFAMDELETALVFAVQLKDVGGEKEQAARERVRRTLQVIEDALGSGDYLVGNRFGVADVVVASVLGFAKRMELVDGFPRIDAYLERIEERPARQRALAVS